MIGPETKGKEASGGGGLTLQAPRGGSAPCTLQTVVGKEGAEQRHPKLLDPLIRKKNLHVFYT